MFRNHSFGNIDLFKRPEDRILSVRRTAPVNRPKLSTKLSFFRKRDGGLWILRPNIWVRLSWWFTLVKVDFAKILKKIRTRERWKIYLIFWLQISISHWKIVVPVENSVTFQISMCFIKSIIRRGSVVFKTFRLLIFFDVAISRKPVPWKNTVRVNDIDESRRSKACR